MARPRSAERTWSDPRSLGGVGTMSAGPPAYARGDAAPLLSRSRMAARRRCSFPLSSAALRSSSLRERTRSCCWGGQLPRQGHPRAAGSLTAAYPHMRPSAPAGVERPLSDLLRLRGPCRGRAGMRALFSPAPRRVPAVRCGCGQRAAEARGRRAPDRRHCCRQARPCTLCCAPHRPGGEPWSPEGTRQAHARGGRGSATPT